VIALPPSESGASQLMVALPHPHGVTVIDLGAPGTLAAIDVLVGV